MNTPNAADPALLARQSLGRPLDEKEATLANAMEAIFATGNHDFENLAIALEAQKVVRPSGETGAWTLAVLEWELARINRSLDAAYEKKPMQHDHAAETRHA